MFGNPRFYDSLPLVDKQATPLDKKRGHLHYDRRRLSGRITGLFEAVQPLHVGTGLFVPPEAIGVESDIPLVKSFHQVQGRLTIPGSSLKGPVRSLVEAITYSCVSKTKNKKLDRTRHQECQYQSKRHTGNLCPACQIFGAMGYQGQVEFTDSPLITGKSAIHQIPPQYQPKGDQARRYYPHGLVDERGRIWPLEIAMPGSRFGFSVQFKNLTPAELGIILIAFGQGSAPICLKVGAGKSSGLGAIHFTEVRVQHLDFDQLYGELESEDAWQPVNVQECLGQAHGLLREQEAVQAILTALACNQVVR